MLLANFGEDYAAKGAGQPCGNCDNCLDPPAAWDATVPAQKALSCVYRSGQRFGAAHIIDILRGSESERIRQFGHDQLSTYGVGTDIDARVWKSVLRQLVAQGLLDVDAEGYGGLRLTPASRGVLKGETQVMLRKPTNTRERARTTRAATGADIDIAAADRPLFEALRALRGRLAREQNVPAYVIFHDATLREIARLRPISHGQLGGIGGVGAGKLERYGDAVLETVLDAD